MLLKDDMVESTGSKYEGGTEGFRAGELIGIRFGRPRRDRKVDFVMDGPDQTLVGVYVRTEDVRQASTQEFLEALVASLQPYPQEEPAVIEVTVPGEDADASERYRQALLAMGALHRQPDLERAATLLTVWRQLPVAPEEAELLTLAEQLATWLELNPEEADQLRGAARGG
jgi:hypothetical protein